jgi:hypothetical protein
MKRPFIFIGGMATGALLLYLILYVIINRTESSEKEQLRQQLIETVSRSLKDLNKETENQYVEVKGKKGNVTLRTGMPKDSVQILVGKPDQVRLNTFGGSAHENWGYKLKNKYLADLEIDFVDGKLEGVRQN